MSEYYPLQGAPLEMGFEGGKVDLLSLGVAQISLQRIAEKVARENMMGEGAIAPGWDWAKYPSRWLQTEYPRFVQGEVREASAGSFNSLLDFTIIAVLSDPHITAVLDNLSANIVWAISMSGIRSVKSHVDKRSNIPQRFRRRNNDPYKVEPFVRDTILIAQQNPTIKAIRYRSNQDEVILDIEYYRERRQ